MTDDQSKAPPGARPNPKVFYALSALLVLTFLWRLLTPAHEYPGRTATLLEVAIDAACIVGLIAIRKVGPLALFWAALICGLGLFAIRLHSDASWWTGHYSYWLTPR